uniref:Uncharacterized protein n=1 Tax=Arundo donax TaxID=35708 RepID=A0A0A9GF93_ARUDO
MNQVIPKIQKQYIKLDHNNQTIVFLLRFERYCTS